MTEATLTGQDILFRGQGLLGINKPAGTPVHASRMLEDQPQTLLSQLRKLEGYMVHAIHRLDRPVSGVMLMTGDRNRLKELGQAFENRAKQKANLFTLFNGFRSKGFFPLPFQQECANYSCIFDQWNSADGCPFLLLAQFFMEMGDLDGIIVFGWIDDTDPLIDCLGHGVTD